MISTDARKLASFDIPTRDNIHRYQCNNPILLHKVYTNERNNGGLYCTASSHFHTRKSFHSYARRLLIISTCFVRRPVIDLESRGTVLTIRVAKTKALISFAADLRLCFRTLKMLVFSWRGSCKMLVFSWRGSWPRYLRATWSLSRLVFISNVVAQHFHT